MNESLVIHPESLDWGQIFWQWVERSNGKLKPPRNELALMKHTLCERYRSVLIERLHLKSSWSLLDMGCGDGSLTIPIAKRVRYVLAIDRSKSQIKRAIEFAEEEGVSDKITFVCEKFHDALKFRRAHACDVVLASRSVGLVDRNVKRDIVAMDSLAKKRVYLTVYNGDGVGFYADASAAVGRTVRRTIWPMVVTNTLWQMGIRPNVDHFQSERKYSYDSIEQAMQTFTLESKYYSKGGESPSLLETSRLRDFLKGALILGQDGKYYSPKSTDGWDLIWWDK